MKSTLIIFCFLFSHSIFAQPEYSLPFLKNLPQAPNQVNPAIITDHKINFSFPGIYGGFLNSGFQWKDILTETADGYDLDLEPALANMKNTGNAMRASFSASAYSFTFRVKENYQLSFFHNTTLDFQLAYPKALPALIWRGNGAFVGEDVEIAPNINIMGYTEYGFGLAVRANDKATFGGNLKYVNGFVGVNTQRASTVLTTGAEYYQLMFNNDIDIRTAGLVDIFDGDEDDLLVNSDPSYFINGGSAGFSVDLGMDYQVNDKLNIQVAVQDFGYISWDQNVLSQTSKGEFTYEGEIIRPFADGSDGLDLEAVRDSLSDLFDFTSRPSSFLSNFPLKAYISGAYEIRPKLTIGASAHIEYHIDAKTSNAVGAVHVQKQFGRILYLGGIAGFHSKSFAFLGANAVVELGPVQLFFITDNLITMIDPTLGRMTNFRTGLNLNFLRKKKEEAVPENKAVGSPGYFN